MVSSDEYGCDGNVPPENRLNIFHCAEPDGRFLPIAVVCDQNPDCLHADDELNCPCKYYSSSHNYSIFLLVFKDNLTDTFVCKNGQTIPQSQLCDLYPDCWDKSDETDCLGFPCSDRRSIFIQDDRFYQISLNV